VIQFHNKDLIFKIATVKCWQDSEHISDWSTIIFG